MSGRILYCIILINVISNFNINAQDLSQIGKASLFSYSGGISANTIFYEGSGIRDPFTYVVNGNVNFNISGIYNIPLTFAYSNQNFTTNQPFRFNRLSLHPSYKWITAHIGDVSMSFSPYTLSGHQFTGLGVDLTPRGKFKVSAMYGRFIRPVEYDGNVPENIPTYKRIGYGLKTQYNLNKGSIGLIFFKAKDELNSLTNPIPLEAGVTPKENLVVSLNGSYKIFDNAGSIDVEYATSAVTEDANAEDFSGSLGLLSFIFNEKLTTSYYDAFNIKFNYAVGTGSIGAGYERIDPDYKTLGAYYFNNDLENITVNASQTIFNGKLGIAVNAGLQRDNLDKTKSNDLKRVVSAVNLNLTASDKTTVTASFSNFQSFTNIRSQFDYINEITQFDNIDTLNFKQQSKNATLSVAHILSNKKDKRQNINLNLSFQEVVDIQEQAFTNIENTINNSNLFNSSASYTLAFPQKALSFSAAVNATLSTTQDINSVAVGPTLVVSKQFFEKQLRTTLSSSYNTNSTDGIKQNDILNFRFNAGYRLLEKHQLNLSVLSLFRKNVSSIKSNDFTVTLGYNYSFSSKKQQLGPKRKKVAKGSKKEKSTLPTIKLRYKGEIYQGSAPEILNQIASQYSNDLKGFDLTSINTIKNDIDLLKNEKAKDIRDRLIDYLDAIHNYLDFKKKYNGIVYRSVMMLKSEAKRIDRQVETKFATLFYKVRDHKFNAENPDNLDSNDADFKNYQKLYKLYLEERQRFVGHRWMQREIADLQTLNQVNRNKNLKRFTPQFIDKAYKIYANSNDLKKVEAYLVVQLIEFYQSEAKGKVDPTKYQLKYTEN